MKRRSFLKTAAGAGMAGLLPMTLVKPAFGQTANRFLITVSATGGWDPTSLVDPKGDALRSDGLGPVNNYAASEIKSAGNILYAPYSNQIEAPEIDSAGHMDNFFSKHYQRLLVINGIDTQTNSHDTGKRFVWSGKAEEGYPSVGALAAAPFADQPMAYITNGGYDFTASLVAPVRTSGTRTFNQLAFPNSQYPDDPQRQGQSFFSDNSYSRIQQARTARLARLRAAETLPRRARQMDVLQTSRNSDVNLSLLLQFLPGELSDGLQGQAEIAVAALRGGLAVSANLSLGGFDTHGNHDRDQTESLTELLAGVDRLWDLIEANGMQNQVTVVIGSDFGRTPFYNNAGGKDHWNVTSVMAMGAGVTGNRVIGQTNENFNVRRINTSNLEADSNGLVITPRHVHRALRDFIGVPADLDNQFPIAVESLPLFA